MSERSTVTEGPWSDPSDEDDGGPSAEHVSMSVSTFEKLVDELGRQSEENARLRAALAVRPAVSLATGVLMFRYGLEEKRALELLSRWSDRNHKGLREFATSLIEVAARDPESLEVELLGAPPKTSRP